MCEVSDNATATHVISAITVDSETATATETATEASVTVLSCHIYSQGNKKEGTKSGNFCRLCGVH